MGRPKFRPEDPQAGYEACRRYRDGTNGWRPRGVPHRRSHILDLAGREGGAASPSAAPPPFPASAPRRTRPGDNRPDAERRPTDRARDRLRAARGHPGARSRAQGAVRVRRVERQPPVHAAVLLGHRAPARHRAAAARAASPTWTRASRAPAECDEYPVLTMWTMRAAAWVSGSSTTGFFYSSAIAMWIAAFVIAFCLYLLVGDRVLYFVLAPTLALYATMNWDLLAVAFAMGGTLAYLRRRDGWSGVLLGLGAAAKVFPMLLVVPFVAGRFRGKEPDRGFRLAWTAVAAWVAVNLPVRAPGADGLVGVLPLQRGPLGRLGQPVVRWRANAPPARPARTRDWSTWRPWGCSSRGSRSCGSSRRGATPGSRDGRSGSRSWWCSC